MKIRKAIALVLALVMFAPACYAPRLAVTAAADYFDANRVQVSTVVIVIDTQGVGKAALQTERQKLRQMYWDIGEDLVVADGDWLCYTAVPFGLKSPLTPGDDWIQRFYDEFIPKFFPNIAKDFHWDRVFIFENNLGLEPKDFGPYLLGTYLGSPDGLFCPGCDPFGTICQGQFTVSTYKHKLSPCDMTKTNPRSL